MRWEYLTYRYETGGFLGGKVNTAEVTAALNRLGAQGWELVSTFETIISNGASRDVFMILKRPVGIPAAT